jgi:hypothetical protein
MFKQNNLPFLLLILYIGKVFSQAPSLFDAIAIVALSLLFGFKLYLDHIKKPDFSQEISEKMEVLRNETLDRTANLERVMQSRLDDFDGKISGVTLAVSQKPKGNLDEFKWGRQ